MLTQLETGSTKWNRLPVRVLARAVACGLFLALSWFGMMAVHELGHVLGAWLTGGKLDRVVLHPLRISRTDLALNPQPLIVAWAGPLFGVVLPLLLWRGVRVGRWRYSHLLQFFAGFCLVANGAYIGGGSFARVGDCGVLLRHGAAPWQLWLFGGLSVTLGLFMWHGLGRPWAGGSQRIRDSGHETQRET